MSQRNKQAPSTWDAYERGRASSFGSLESVPENEQQNLLSSSTPAAHHIPPIHGDEEDGGALRRRSSFGKRFDSIRHLGGPNSIDNFARSLQRAAGFREITPVRRNSVTLSESEQEPGPARSSPEQSTTGHNRSLLRQQLRDYRFQDPNESAVHDDRPTEVEEPTEESSLLPMASRQTLKSTTGSIVPGSLLPSALGTSYGSISSRLTAAARQRASILIMEQEEASRRAREEPEEFKEEPPRQIEREVRPDGEVIDRTVGESTVPMTIFNSTNVLIGVGILALPLGIRYSGWVIGLTFLTLAAFGTSYTAKLLAKCLDTNTGSTTYGDIAFLAFDTWGRNFVETLFILELTAANVALIILFADSMNSLIPAVGVTEWKAIVAIGLIPLNFVPFKTLSVSSVIGIFSCLGIVAIVFADGLIKPRAPGSLRDVAKTYAFPEEWRTVPLSLGLFMAPWGGHSVFPAIYKDMRHPQKYGRALKYTYIFTYGLDLSMAVLGYLMFGDKVRDEVTANILRSTAYPHALSVIIVVLIAIIPITKIPLSNRPMTDTVNKKFYLDLRQMDPKARMHSERSWKHRLARGSIAVLANLIQLGISIGFPDFDSIMALMGSALCFTICIILPVSFYLRIFSSEGKEISLMERIIDWGLLVVCGSLAVVGTVFAILPKDKIGAAG
ncbi:Vacuolar amino acid transporter [Cladophialophora carrionii]|uniref:Vacuolar amino acid transporter n=1 Tax=Cladophialophora carrionii TaxID=86049 RepID=A0A1C1D1W7_9EURO|nr:Vacuolar amino acid transporter [Cladophialophora carrionii]